MKLEEYLEDELNSIEAFEKYWKRMHKKDPINFPLDLQPGEWDEQFIIFCDLGENN